MSTHKTAVFVDILGFARLVEKYENVVGLIDGFDNSSRPLDETLDDPGRTILEKQFAAFHVTLDMDVKRAMTASAVTSIVFSDSAFVVFEHSEIALFLAQLLMQHMLMVHVPVRMGIAFGSFKGVRFNDDSGDSIRLHTAQFLGSSIVRSFGTESCGHPGMRILLHPDLPVRADLRPLLCPITEAPPKPLRLDVVHELNYLNPPEGHDLPPSGLPSVPGHQPPVFTVERNVVLEDAVRAMRGETESAFQFQYDYTLRAMASMKAAYAKPTA